MSGTDPTDPTDPAADPTDPAAARALRVLHFPERGPPRLVEVPHETASLQALVGGYLDCVPLHPRVDLWCHDEFLLSGAHPSAVVRIQTGEQIEICGAFYLAGHDGEGNTMSLGGIFLPLVLHVIKHQILVYEQPEVV